MRIRDILHLYVVIGNIELFSSAVCAHVKNIMNNDAQIKRCRTRWNACVCVIIHDAGWRKRNRTSDEFRNPYKFLFCMFCFLFFHSGPITNVNYFYVLQVFIVSTKECTQSFSFNSRSNSNDNKIQFPYKSVQRNVSRSECPPSDPVRTYS